MAIITVLPGEVNVLFRPNNLVVLDMEWPPGYLAGKTFEAAVGETELPVTLNDDVLSVTVSALITNLIQDHMPWKLYEVGGNDILVGEFIPTTEGAPPSLGTVQVQVDTGVIQASISSSGKEGPKGDTGDQGIPGPPGGTHHHDQDILSDHWIIDHNLGRRPASIFVEDSAGNEWKGDIVHASLNRTEIFFTVAFIGQADLS